MTDKKNLSERDICTKYITPAITAAGWDLHTQICEEVSFTKGRVIVRGKLHARGEQKRADHILYYKSNIPAAVIEAKENGHSIGAGMQQALNYAETLGAPGVFSSTFRTRQTADHKNIPKTKCQPTNRLRIALASF